MDDPEPPPEMESGLNPIKTYSLEEVAAMVLPPEWKSPARWLARKLKAGDIGGYELGRGKWRMTHADVEDLIERHRNNVKPWSKRTVAAEPAADSDDADVPIINGKPYGGLTRRSWLYHTRANMPGTTQYNRRRGVQPSPPPEPLSYKKVKPESEAVIFNMPELSEAQQALLNRVRREREVVLCNEYRKPIESLVRRNLVDYSVVSYGRGYRFTVRAKD